MSFSEKRIEIRLTLWNKQYSNGGDTKIIKSLPCKVSIQLAGLPAKDQANIVIHGLKQEDMEALTWLTWSPLSVGRNKIEIYAGEGDNLSLAYYGEIQSAVPEYNGAPDVYITITAISAYYAGRIPVSPYSFKGSVPIASILDTLAKQMNYTFVNAGSNQQIKNPYLKGSAMQQIVQLKEISGANIRISNGVIKLIGKNKSIEHVVSPENGLIGFPTPTAQGFRIRTFFSPVFELANIIRIENSIVPNANGAWSIFGITHNIGQMIDNAPWFTELELEKAPGK